MSDKQILVDYTANSGSKNVRYHIHKPSGGGAMLCGRVMMNTITTRVDPDATDWMCQRCLKAYYEGKP